MRAIILAAGRGSRMKEKTADQPKCFVKLHGKRLIDWQLEALYRAGITEVAIVTGYKKNSFSFNLKYFENTRWNKTNMVMSLLEANSWLIQSTCIVSYSDIIYSADAVLRLKSATEDISITYDKDWLKIWSKRFVNPLSDAESFKVNAQGILTEIGKKTDSTDNIQGQYMGLLKITPDGWSTICSLLEKTSEAETLCLDMTALLQKLLNEGAL